MTKEAGKKKPWMQFYPSDWRGDQALRMCSIGARGLWMEMLCVMHTADPYGELIVNGKPITDQQLAGLAGLTLRDMKPLLNELRAAGVFSDDDGIIFSRRMKRDHEKAARDKANGEQGGNPKLKTKHKVGVNQQNIEEVNGMDKAHIPYTRIHKPEKKKDALPSAAPLPFEGPKTPEFELFERGKQILGSNAGGMIANLLKAKGSVAQARAAIEQSSEKQDPREYISKIIHKATGPPDRDGYGDPAL